MTIPTTLWAERGAVRNRRGSYRLTLGLRPRRRAVSARSLSAAYSRSSHSSFPVTHRAEAPWVPPRRLEAPLAYRHGGKGVGPRGVIVHRNCATCATARVPSLRDCATALAQRVSATHARGALPDRPKPRTHPARLPEITARRAARIIARLRNSLPAWVSRIKWTTSSSRVPPLLRADASWAASC